MSHAAGRVCQSAAVTSTLGKRAVDLVVGTLLLVVAVPVVVAVAAAMGVALGTWPIFTQERVGRDGRPFRIVKIRTVPTHMPRYASKHELGELPACCRAVRQLHLDELPQLLLVVTGRLSLVGPRPEMPFLAAAMDPGFAELRASVRPGCTGLWQVSSASLGLTADAPQYDRWYVTWGNLRVDAWILWRTALVVLGLGRPVALEDVPRWATWRPRPSAEAGPAAVADAVL